MAPSLNSCWLLWNLDADLTADESHTYTITLFALSESPSVLGDTDSVKVDLSALTTAISTIPLDEAVIEFTN